MKIIGIVTKHNVLKAKNVFNFADEIVSLENIGCDKSLYGQRALYDRLRIVYKKDGKTQTSEISAQIGGRTKLSKDQKMSNSDYAKKDTKFIEACKLVDLKPSTRQASKWRNKKGKAYKTVVTGELKQ